MRTPEETIQELQTGAGNRALADYVGRLKPAVRFGRDIRSRTRRARIQRVMANVRFDFTDPLKPFVKSVSIDRGSGTAGGAHATAFVIFVDAAVNAVGGEDFPGAVKNLLALSDRVTALPGYKRALSLVSIDADAKAAVDRTDKLLAAIKGNPDYQNLDAKDRGDWAPIVNELIKDYLLLRNSAPGTYVPKDQKASGMKGIGEKQEREGADKLYALRDEFSRAIKAGEDPKDPGGKMTKGFALGMWLTFDSGIIPARAPKELLEVWYLRMAPAIAQHVIACFEAYPEIEAKHSAIQGSFVKQHVAKELDLSPKQADKLLEYVAGESGFD